MSSGSRAPKFQPKPGYVPGIGSESTPVRPKRHTREPPARVIGHAVIRPCQQGRTSSAELADFWDVGNADSADKRHKSTALDKRPAREGSDTLCIWVRKTSRNY